MRYTVSASDPAPKALHNQGIGSAVAPATPAQAEALP
jgi:hypothetical protein